MNENEEKFKKNTWLKLKFRQTHHVVKKSPVYSQPEHFIYTFQILSSIKV